MCRRIKIWQGFATPLSVKKGPNHRTLVYRQDAGWRGGGGGGGRGDGFISQLAVCV
jgi:hypothetical protein